MADPNDPQTNTSNTNTGEQGGGTSKTGIYRETVAPDDPPASDDPEYNGGMQKTGLYGEQGA